MKTLKVAVCGNLGKTKVHEAVTRVVDRLQAMSVPFAIEVQLADVLGITGNDCERLAYSEMSEQAELVVTFGGDGTILTTAREIGPSGIPILGVKIGGMGFLADLTPEEFEASLPEILAGQFDVSVRMVLQAEFPGNASETVYALNDVVVDKGAVSRVNRIETYIDAEFLNTYIGDGLIISTATGSTAYSLASGGPILMPAMQAIIINPINPHTLGARPVVIPADRSVRLKVDFAPDSVLLSADGKVALELKTGMETVVSRADHVIRLASYSRRNFYDVLRAKLNWGEDIRENDA